MPIINNNKYFPVIFKKHGDIIKKDIIYGLRDVCKRYHRRQDFNEQIESCAEYVIRRFTDQCNESEKYLKFYRLLIIDPFRPKCVMKDSKNYLVDFIRFDFHQRENQRISLIFIRKGDCLFRRACVGDDFKGHTRDQFVPNGITHKIIIKKESIKLNKKDKSY